MKWGVSRAECCHRSGLVSSCYWVICLLAVDDMDHLVGGVRGELEIAALRSGDFNVVVEWKQR